MFDESDWSQLQTAGAYERSKTMAEQEAWNFVRALPNEEKFELCTVNPVMQYLCAFLVWNSILFSVLHFLLVKQGWIVGPMLSANNCTSAEVFIRMLSRQMPMV